MTNQSRLLHCFAVLVVLLIVSFPARADQGKELFDKNCASCHTIGGGDSGGPDLKGVTAARPHEWIETIIIEPDKLTAAKDPVQLELVKKYGFEMPKLGIGHDDALKIIAYLAAAGGTSIPSAAQPAGEQMVVTATPELVAMGKLLFTGKKGFAKGGAPCAACHPFTYPGITGGNLSKADLATSYQRLGDAGMNGALKSLKFPIMKKVYQDRPLTDEESAALMALFKDSAIQKEKDGRISLPLAGGGLFVVLMVGLTLYKRRIG